RRVWPTKFRSVDLPVFVVPIWPIFAKQLFDTELASQDLFGLPPELGFRLENAYYRSARPQVIHEAPARILWYVSQGKGTPEHGAGRIRAASYLDAVRIGKPKALYSEHRRLGVFDWSRVL